MKWKRLMYKAAMLVLMGFVVFAGGCATMDIEPPPGIFKADVGFPPPGTKWLKRRTDQRGTTGTVMFTVLEETTYKGRQVYRVDVGGLDAYIYDRGTANLFAIVRGEKELFAFLPDDGKFSWPLWVGKSWTGRYDYYDHEYRIFERSVETSYNVEAYEDITVPTGTFKAFRIHSSSRRGTVLSTTWYAPQPRIIIKAIHEQTRGHPMGLGRQVDDVIKYHPTK